MVNTTHWTLLKTSVRFFIKHPWQLWLTILSIALGSAVMIAVDIANQSAKQSFADSVDQVSGRATHYLVPRNNGYLDETLYTRLRVEWGLRDSAPLLESELAIHGLQYQLIGIDPFAQSEIQTQQSTFPEQQNWLQLLTQANTVLISTQIAQQLQLSSQSRLKVRINQSEHILHIAGTYGTPDQAGYDHVLLTDIATAQELLGRVGQLDRIALVLNQNQVETLMLQIPDSVQLIPSASRTNALDQMTAAFRINLTAMSLLAMLVGCFLVYNTMTFSVLQRRQQFAIERMLGITGLQIFLQMIVEALLFAILGGISGIVLGIVLSKSLLKLVTRTINDVYAEISTSLLHIEPTLLLKGIGLTLVAVLLATLGPALEAAKIAPATVHRISELEHRNQRMTPILMTAGVLLMMLALFILNTFSRQLIAGFAALFSLVIGYSLIMPSLIKTLVGVFADYIPASSTVWKMAIRGINRSLSRTNLAIIALAVAVSATVGVGIMTTSFRDTLADWLTVTLQNDLYISSTNADGTKVEGNLEKFWLAEIQKLAGIRAISHGKTAHLQINSQSVALLILNPGHQLSKGFNLLEGNTDQQWQRYLNGEVVLVSEPYAYHQQLSVGDQLQATTNEGNSIALEIGAVFQDYSSSQGMIVIHRKLYEKNWQDRSISSIGLLLEKNADAEQLKQRISSLAGQGKRAVRIRYNKEIRDQSLAIFDRTFAITDVLRLLVVMVAFVGVFSALMVLLMEKQREYAVLRATGLTPAQLTQLLLIQTAMTGLLAGLLALPLGWVMSELLIDVINQRSFGWSMNSVLPISVLFQAVLLSVAAALLAAYYPIKHLATMSLPQSLREL
ncbi:MAG: FtsX-like permease family protein [Gammaproteobacteria bacterium]|nr:FtsX-like permease family protein [Gammaproteobacteria bacterium]